MNKRFLISLLFVAVGISLSAIWAVYYHQRDEGSLSQGDIVLPGLHEALASVNRIQMTSAGASAPYTLQHTDTGWVVKERNNYPANFSKIRMLLEQLSNAKFYEPKTRTPDHYAVLGVTDITNKDSPGVLVEVFVNNQSEPYRLLVGKLATTWDGSYARLPGQVQSWLLDRQIPADSIITAWLNNVILNIEPMRIYKVTYTNPKGELLVVARNNQQSKHFAVQNLPAGKTVRYDTIVDGVPHDFENIVLRDVQLSTEISWSLVNTHKVEFQTYDGLVVNIDIQKIEDRYFLTVKSHYDAALAKTMNATDVALVSKVTAESEAIRKRTESWVYEVNEHVYVDLTKNMKDVLPEK